MTDQPQKKGMSQGCKIGLIVGIVLIVLAAAAAVTCWVYKDDLAKLGAVTLVDGFKTTLANEPVAGIDTTQFDALADAFKQKLSESELDYQKYQAFFQSIQSVPQDEKIDEDEVWMIVDGMIEYFPDLEDLRPTRMTEDEGEGMDEGMEPMDDSSSVMEDDEGDQSSE